MMVFVSCVIHFLDGFIKMIKKMYSSSPIFKVIPTSAHPQLLAEFKSIVVDRGEVLLTQGQPGKGLFLILELRTNLIYGTPGTDTLI